MQMVSQVTEVRTIDVANGVRRQNEQFIVKNIVGCNIHYKVTQSSDCMKENFSILRQLFYQSYQTISGRIFFTLFAAYTYVINKQFMLFTLYRCSDGIDRHRHSWLISGCDKNSVTKVNWRNIFQVDCRCVWGSSYTSETRNSIIISLTEEIRELSEGQATPMSFGKN